MSHDLVRYDSKGHIATITLNRPDKLNALSNSLVAELRDAFIHLKQSVDRVAIVTAAGERAPSRLAPTCAIRRASLSCGSACQESVFP